MALTVAPVREFVWPDLREGMVQLGGLSRGARSLAVLGFALLLLMVASVVFNDVWRALFALTPMQAGNRLGLIGRGGLVPEPVLPLTLFVLAVAWSFILAGALHSHPLIRVLALGVFLAGFLPWAGRWLGVFGTSTLALGAVAAALAGVPAMFAIRWRAQARPAAEFVVFLLLLTVMLGVSQAQGVALLRASGAPLLLAHVEIHLFSLQGLVLPLLFYVGVDIAHFTRQASGWAVSLTVTRLPRWAPALLLVVFFAHRLYAVLMKVLEQLERSNGTTLAAAYSGALGELICVAGVWWLVQRLAGDTASPSTGDVATAADTYGFKLVLAFGASSLLGIVLAGVALAVFTIAGTLAGDMVTGQRLTTPIIGLVSAMSDGFGMATWRIVLGILALAAATYLARRKRSGPALYLGIFGALQCWWELTKAGGVLGALSWRGAEPVDFWWVMALCAIGVMWLVRRVMTAARVNRLLFLLTITWLLRQTDFIENPFNPVAGLAGFTGAGFLAFVLLWDALTAGSWANEDTPALPRVGRIFLYLGYVLFTVALVHWALSTRDLEALERFTGGTALVGLDRFGRPLLYGIFAATIALPAHGGLDVAEPFHVAAGPSKSLNVHQNR